MVCNKHQLVAGIQSFVTEEIVPGIQDKPLQMALFALSQFPAILEGFVDKPFMKVILNESEGNYDLDMIHQALALTMDKYGSFPISIKPVPLLLPSEISINLTRSDVDSLIRHIEKVVQYG